MPTAALFSTHCEPVHGAKICNRLRGLVKVRRGWKIQAFRRELLLASLFGTSVDGAAKQEFSMWAQELDFYKRKLTQQLPQTEQPKMQRARVSKQLAQVRTTVYR